MPRLGLLVALACLLLPGVAHAGNGGLNVTIAGPDGSRVTGNGISCPTDCSDTASWPRDGSSPVNRLTAGVPSGYSVEWTQGCTVVRANPNQCDAFYGDLDLGDANEVI